MTLKLRELDNITRGHMLAALEDDVMSGRLEMPGLLSREGRGAYVECLREAVRNGNEVTLARSLQDPALWKRRDGYGVPVDIEHAAMTLATTEFGTLYTVGMCLRLEEEGVRQCRVYLAGTEPRSDCVGVHLEGAVVSVSDVLMGHRRYDRPALRIPFAPGCCHSICRMGAVTGKSCPACGAPLRYDPFAQAYSCSSCKRTTTYEKMLRGHGSPGMRQRGAMRTGSSPPPGSLPNTDKEPVLLAICAKAHIVDSMVVEPSAYRGMFCPACSGHIAMSCPKCEHPIRRVPMGAPMTPLPAHAKPPLYCMKCAAGFPWATRARRARHKCSDMWGRLSLVPWIRNHYKPIVMIIVVAGTVVGIVTDVITGILTAIAQYWK